MASSLKLLVGGASAIGASALTSYLLMSDSTVSMIRTFSYCDCLCKNPFSCAVKTRRHNRIENRKQTSWKFYNMYHGQNTSLQDMQFVHLFRVCDLILCSLLVYFFIRKSDRFVELST